MKYNYINNKSAWLSRRARALLSGGAFTGARASAGGTAGKNSLFSKSLLAAAAALAALSSPAVAAVTSNWTSASDMNWGTAGNWSAGVPAAGDNALFSLTNPAALVGKTISLGSARTLGLLDVTGTATEGSYALTIGTAATPNLIFDNLGSVSALQISQNVALTVAANITATAGDFNVTNNSSLGGSIKLAGSVDATGRTISFNAGQDGALTTVSGVITASQIVKNGAGTLRLENTNAVNVAFLFNAGNVIVTKNNALGTGTLALGTGSLTLGLDTASVSLGNSSTTFSSGGALAVSRTTGTGTLTLTLAGTSTSLASGGNAIDVAPNVNLVFGANNVISGGALTKNGGGTLTLANAASTYNGLVVNAGAVNVTGFTGALGIGSGTAGILGKGDVTISGASTILSLTGGAGSSVNFIGGTVRFAGGATFVISGADIALTAGTIDMGGNGNFVFDGNITLGSTATVNNAAGSHMSFARNVNITPGSTIAASGAAFDFNGTGAQTLSSSGTGAVSVSGAMTKSAAGTLTVDSTLKNLTAATLSVTAGTFDLAGLTKLSVPGGITLGGTGTLALGGANQLTGAITFSGTGASLLLNGYNQTAGITGVTVAAGASALIDLGGSSAVATTAALGAINFGNTASMLRFANYLTGATPDVVTTSSALTAAQLSQVWFRGYNKGATLAAGKLTPNANDFLVAEWDNQDAASSVAGDWQWFTPGNWVGDDLFNVPNSSGATAKIGSLTAIGNKSITIAAGQTATVGKLIIDNPASGINTFNIGGAGTLIFDNTAAGAPAELTQKNSTNFSFQNTGGVVLNSDLIVDANSYALFAFDISGSGKIIKRGAGYMYIWSTPKTFTGGIVLEAGTLTTQIDTAANPNWMGTGTLEIKGGYLFGYDFFKKTLRNPLIISGDFSATAFAFTYAGDVTLSAVRTISAAGATVTAGERASVTFSAATNLVGPGGLTKTGSYIMEILSPNNTFSGGLTVAGGASGVLYTTVQSGGLTIGALEAGKNYLGSGDITVNSSSRLYVATQGYASVIKGGTVTLNNSGILRFSDNGAVTLTGGTITTTTPTAPGALFVTGDLTFNGTAMSGVILSPDTSGNSAGNVIKATAGNGAVTGIYSIQKYGSGTTTLDSSIASITTTSASYLYGGALRLSADNQILGGASVVVQGGALDAAGHKNDFGVLYLRGDGSLLLGSGGQLTFSGRASGAVSWYPEKTLIIQNADGVWLTTGAGSFVRFNSNPNFTGADAALLGNIAFTGYEVGADVVANGGKWYLVPAASSVPTIEWTGNAGGAYAGTKWSVAGDWMPNTVPNSATASVSIRDLDQKLNVNGVGKVIDVDGAYTVNRLNIESTAPSFTIGGAGTLTLGGTNAIIKHAGGSVLTFAANAALAGATELRVDVPTTSGYLNWTGSVSGAGGFTKTGAGTLRLANGTNTNTGDFTWKDSSLIQVAADGAVLGKGIVHFGDEATDTLTLESYFPGSASSSRPTPAATHTVDTGGWTLAGNLTLQRETVFNQLTGDITHLAINGTGTLDAGQHVLTSYGNASLYYYLQSSTDYIYQDLTLAGKISGTGGLKKAGYGTLTLNGANDFTGDVVLAEGLVRVGADQGLGKNNTIYFGDGVSVSQGIQGWDGAAGTALTAGTRTLSNKLDFSSVGAFYFFNNLTFDYAGTSILEGTGRMLWSVASAAHVYFGKDHVLAGTGGIDRTGISSGTLRFEGANTFSGGVTLNQGFMQIGADSVMNAGNVVSGALGTGGVDVLGAPTLQPYSAADSGILTRTLSNTINLNYSQGQITATGLVVSTVAGSDATTLILNAPVLMLKGDSSQTTFTIGSGAVLRIDSQITNNGALSSGFATGTSATAGRIELTNANNTFSESVRANGGTVAAVSATGDITIGTLAVGKNQFGTATLFANNTGVLEANVADGKNVTIGKRTDGAPTIYLNTGGKFNVVGGTAVKTTIADGALIDSTTATNRGTFTTPGTLYATNTTLGVKLVTPNFQIGTGAVNSGTVKTGDTGLLSGVQKITLAGGTLNLAGNNQATGDIVVTQASTVTFGPGGTALVPTILSIKNLDTSAGSILTFTDWAGSTTDGLGSTRVITTLAAGTIIDNVKLTTTSSSAIVIYNAASQYVLVPFTADLIWTGATGNSDWTGFVTPVSNWRNPVTLAKNEVPNAQGVRATFDTTESGVNLSGKTIVLPTTNITVGTLRVTGTNKQDFTIGGTGTLYMDRTGMDQGVSIDMTGPTSLTIKQDIALIYTAGITKNNLAVTVDNATSVLTLDGSLSGPFAAVTKTGAGTLVLNKANTFSGGLVMQEGTLLAGDNAAAGAGTLTLAGGTIRGTSGIAGNADTDRTLANAYDLAGGTTLAGTKKLAVTGAGTASAASTLTVTNAAATLELGSAGSALTGAGKITTAGAGATNILANLGTTGGIEVTGGTTTLSGTNTYSGGTKVSAGTLQIASDTNLGVTSSALDLAGGTLKTTAAVTTARATNITAASTINTGATLTHNGAITGSAALTKLGTGALVLTKDNTYSGTIAVNDGTLQLGNGTGTTGDTAGTINVAATKDVVFNYNGAKTRAGKITGAGNVSVTAGDVTLSNATSGGNDYAGTTTINAGSLTISGTKSGTGAVTVKGTSKLAVTGAMTGATTLESGATLAGTGNGTTTGIITGNVNMTAGGILQPGMNGIGTLAIAGSLTLGSTSILDWELGTAGVIGGATNDLVTVSGALNLGGTNLNLANYTTLDTGIYTLFTTNSAATGNITLTAAQVAAGLYVNITATAVQLVKADATDGLFYWDGAGANQTTVGIQGGNGTWDAVTTNKAWTNQNGAIANNKAWVDGNYAVFGAESTTSGGTVTVTTISATGIEVRKNYTFNSGTLTLTGAAEVNVASTMTATVNTVIAGTTGLSKTGTGALVLGGTNTFTGALAVTAGTVTVSSDANLGAAAATINLGAATLKTTSAFTTARGITVSAAGILDLGGDLTYTGNITGTGALTKTGTGTLILTKDNTYASAITISAGGLQLGDGTGTTGSVAGNIVNNGTGTAFNYNGAKTYAGVISGTAGITVTKGDLTLTGTNTYAGTTTVTAGSLTIAGSHTGTGNTLVNGTSKLIVTGITKSGTTTIASGATLLGNGNGTTTGVIDGNVNMTAGGTLQPGVSGVGTLTITGNLTLGSGTILDWQLGTPGVVGGATNDLVKVGGALALGGATLQVNSIPTATGVYTIFQTASQATGTLNLDAALTGASYSVQILAGAVNIIKSGTTDGFFYWDGAGANQTTAGIQGGSGTWDTVAANKAWTNPAGDVVNNGPWQADKFAIFGMETGTAGGIVTVTTVSASGMQVKKNYSFTGGTLTLTGGAEINVDDTMTANVGSVLNGTAGLRKTGAGTLNLTGANTFAGALKIETGTVTVAADTALGGASATLNLAGGTLKTTATMTTARATSVTASSQLDVTGTLTHTGAVTGTAALEKIGAGTLILASDNALSGLTTVTGGTLQLGAAGSTGSVAGDIANNATLAFNYTGAKTYAGVISGTGTTNITAGTLTLSGANTAGGAMNVNGTSKLFVTGSTRNATTTIAAGALLAGTGTITGDVLMTAGGTLQPGNSGVGKLGITGNLTLGTGTILDWQLATPDVSGGATNDLVTVGGTLNLGGVTLNLANAASLSTGVYTLFETTSAAGGLLNLSAAMTAANFTVQITAGAVNIIKSGASDGNNVYWDGAGANQTTAGIQGGSGTWDTVAANKAWTNPTGDIVNNAAWTTGKFAIFGAETGTAGGNITVVAASAAGMEVRKNYTFDSGTLTLTGTGEIKVSAGITATVNSTLVGLLTKTGTGTLELSGNNTGLTGTRTVTDGTVVLKNNSALGGTGAIANSATIELATGVTTFANNVTGGNVNLTAASVALTGTNSGVTWNIANGSTATVTTAGNLGTGNVTVAGALNIAGTGAYTFVNTLAGTGTVNATAGAAANVFNFGTRTVDSTFSGTFNANTGTYTYDDNAVRALKAAKFSVNTGANITTGTASTAANIAELILNGGTITDAANKQINATTLTLGTGANIAATVTGNGSILQATTTQAKFFETIVKSGNAVTIGSSLTVNGGANNGTGTVIALNTDADGVYDWALANSDGTNNGLYLAQELKRIDVLAGKTLAVSQASGASYIDVAIADKTTGGAVSFDVGSGSITLTKAATYTGATTLVNGTLKAGVADAIAASSGLTVTAGTFDANGFDQTVKTLNGAGAIALGNKALTVSGGGTYSGAINGTGGTLNVTGGALTLSGTNGYTGVTTLSGTGTKLTVTGSTVGAMSVGTGAILAGTGSVGATTVAGGTLEPGNAGAGTLKINGALILDGASKLNFELGQAGTTGGTKNDLIQVTGALTLNGTLNLAQSAGGVFGPGEYVLITYQSGALTNGGLTIGTVPGGTVASELRVDVATAGQVKLVNTNGLTLNYWDGAAVTANAVEGGNGTWNAAGTNWTTAAGAPNGVWADNAFAMFTTVGGTVTVSGAVRTSGMQFTVTGYTLTGTAGNTVEITGTESEIRVGNGEVTDATKVAAIDAVVIGTAGLNKTGAGTLVLSKANTYAGDTRITEGTLQLNAAGSVKSATVKTGAMIIGSGTVEGILTVEDGGTVSPGLSTVGTLNAGTVVLNNASKLVYELITPTNGDKIAVTGNLTLDGILDVANGGLANSGLYPLFTYGGTLTDKMLQLGALPTGVNALDLKLVTGSGRVDLDYTKAVNPEDRMAYWDGAGVSANNIVDGGDGTWNAASTNWTNANGSFNAAWPDKATAVFAGTNAGTVNVSSGLTAGGLKFQKDGYTLTGASLALSGTAAIDVSPAMAAKLDVQLTGTGFNKTGTGRLVLTKDNTLGATVTAGTLQLGDGTGTTGSVGNIANSGNVEFNYNGAKTYSGVISGNGSVGVEKGTLTLSAANNYSGATTVNGTGTTLVVTGSTTSTTTTVNTGAVLAGTGTIGGNVNVVGGTIAPGTTGAGTLKIGGNLVLDAGSHLNYDLGKENVVGSNDPLNDLIKVTGNLTLAGTLNVTGTTLNLGVYRLIDFGGILTDNGLTVGSAPAGVNTADLKITTGLGWVNLTNTGGLATNYWDGTGTSADGSVGGGSGTWNASNTNWTNQTGSVNAAWEPESFALFTGVGGTVNVSGAVKAAGMQFTVNNYVLGPGTLELTQAVSEIGVGTSATDTAKTATINTTLGGNVGMAKTFGGTLILGGDNTYTGNTSVRQGTLLVNGSIAGAASVESGATLGGTGSIAGTVTAANGAILNPGTGVGATGTLTVGGLILNETTNLNFDFVSTSNNDKIASRGDLTLGGVLNVGATTLANGTYVLMTYTGALVNNNLQLGALPADVNVLDLKISAGSGRVDLTYAKPATDDLRVAYWDGGSADKVADGIISGGAGTWTAGTKNWTNDNGSVNGAWTDKAQAVFQGTAGTVTVSGPVVASALKFNVDGYKLTGDDLALNGTAAAIDVTTGNKAEINLALTGTGAGLNKTGAGSLVLSGTNTYDGNTTVTGGKLLVSGSIASNTTVKNGATLGGNGTITGNVTAENGGRLSPGMSPGILTITGNLTLNAGSFVDFEIGQLVSPSGSPAPANDLINVTGNVALGGATLNVIPNGTLAVGLYRVINYTGTRTGTLSVTNEDYEVLTNRDKIVNLAVYTHGTKNSSNTYWDASCHGDKGGDGEWTADPTNTAWTNAAGNSNAKWTDCELAIFDGACGTVTVNDCEGNVQCCGMQFLTNDYKITGEALTLVNATSDIAVGVMNNDASDAALVATVSSELTGTAQLVKKGAGTLVLTAANTYTGGTEIDAGRLSIADNAHLGDAASAVTLNGGALAVTTDLALARNIVAAANGGAIEVADNAEVVHTGNISGTGQVEKTGAGTLILTDDNAGFTGKTLVSAGTLQLGDGTGSTGLVGGNIENNASVIFDHATDKTYAGVISGTGVLGKVNADNLTLSGNSTYTGGTIIDEGRITATHENALGAAVSSVIINGAARANQLELAFSNGTFDNAIIGAGQVDVSGNSVRVDADNTGFVAAGLWNITGTMLVDDAADLGGAQIDINGANAKLTLTPATGGFTLTNDLTNSVTGAGTLATNFGDKTQELKFAASAGTAFTGTVELGNATMQIAGLTGSDAQGAVTNTKALANTDQVTLVAGGTLVVNGITNQTGTLTYNADNTVDIANAGGSAFSTLTLEGGTLVIGDAKIPAYNKAHGFLTVDTLNLVSGAVQIDTGTQNAWIDSPIPTGESRPEDSLSLLDQQTIAPDMHIVQIASGAVVNGKGAVKLQNLDGVDIEPTSTGTKISQAGDVVATADYGMDLATSRTLGGTEDGLYVGYRLKQLNILDGKTLTLDNKDSVTKILDARITSGGEVGGGAEQDGRLLILDNDGDAAGFIINNPTNRIAEIELGQGKLDIVGENALGLTGNVIINAGTRLNLDTNPDTNVNVGGLHLTDGSLLDLNGKSVTTAAPALDDSLVVKGLLDIDRDAQLTFGNGELIALGDAEIAKDYKIGDAATPAGEEPAITVKGTLTLDPGVAGQTTTWDIVDPTKGKLDINNLSVGDGNTANGNAQILVRNDSAPLPVTGGLTVNKDGKVIGDKATTPGGNGISIRLPDTATGPTNVNGGEIIAGGGADNGNGAGGNGGEIVLPGPVSVTDGGKIAGGDAGSGSTNGGNGGDVTINPGDGGDGGATVGDGDPTNGTESITAGKGGDGETGDGGKGGSIVIDGTGDTTVNPDGSIQAGPGGNGGTIDGTGDGGKGGDVEISGPGTTTVDGGGSNTGPEGQINAGDGGDAGNQGGKGGDGGSINTGDGPTVVDNGGQINGGNGGDSHGDSDGANGGDVTTGGPTTVDHGGEINGGKGTDGGEAGGTNGGNGGDIDIGGPLVVDHEGEVNAGPGGNGTDNPDGPGGNGGNGGGVVVDGPTTVDHGGEINTGPGGQGGDGTTDGGNGGQGGDIEIKGPGDTIVDNGGTISTGPGGDGGNGGNNGGSGGNGGGITIDGPGETKVDGGGTIDGGNGGKGGNGENGDGGNGGNGGPIVIDGPTTVDGGGSINGGNGGDAGNGGNNGGNGGNGGPIVIDGPTTIDDGGTINGGGGGKGGNGGEGKGGDGGDGGDIIIDGPTTIDGGGSINGGNGGDGGDGPGGGGAGGRGGDIIIDGVLTPGNGGTLKPGTGGEGGKGGVVVNDGIIYIPDPGPQGGQPGQVVVTLSNGGDFYNGGKIIWKQNADTTNYAGRTPTDQATAVVSGNYIGGNVERNADGTVKRDTQGNPILIEGTKGLLEMTAWKLGPTSADDVVDQMIIRGNATGHTDLIIHAGPQIGSGYKTTGEGVLVITVGGTSAADAFTMTNDLYAGFYEYELGHGFADNNWYLRSYGLSPTGAIILNSAAASSLAWFSGNDNLMKRMGDLRLADSVDARGACNGPVAHDFDFWVRAYGQQNNIRIDGYIPESRAYTFGGDVGGDMAWATGEGTLYTGAFVGYTGQRTNLTGQNSNAKSKLDGVQGGLYASYMHQNGFYADLVGKGMYSETDFNSGIDKGNSTAYGLGVSAELGWQLTSAQGWFIEPSVMAAYMHAFNDTYDTDNGLRIRMQDSDIGQYTGMVRFGKNMVIAGNAIQPYAKVGYMYQATAGGHVSTLDDSWRPTLDGSNIIAGAGINWQVTPATQVHFDYEGSFGSRSDKPWGVNLGVTTRF